MTETEIKKSNPKIRWKDSIKRVLKKHKIDYELYAAHNRFTEIAERGIRWQYIEENQEDVAGKITNDEWESNGEYVSKAIDIFEKQNPAFQVQMFSAITQKPIDWDHEDSDENSYWTTIRRPEKGVKI